MPDTKKTYIPPAHRITTPEELEEAIAGDVQPDGSEFRDAFADLIRDGAIIDSGKRRNGKIVWVAPENFQ
jgi:hypothetical protein